MAHALLVLTLLVWSFSFMAAGTAMASLSVPQALAGRFAPVLIGSLLLMAWRRPLKIPRAAWPRIVWMGLLSVPCYNFFFFFAAKDVPSGTQALIIAMNPAFTALLAYLVLREPFGWRRLGGLLLASLGVFIVIRYGAGKALGLGYLRSALLLLLAPLSWAGYTVIGKRLPEGTDRLDATLALLAVGSAPLMAFAGPATVRALAAHPPALWSCLYLGLFCTLFGFAAWLWALGRLPATEVAAFVFLNPPLANLWAWLFEGTHLNPAFLLGAAVLLAGVMLIVVAPRARACRAPGAE